MNWVRDEILVKDTIENEVRKLMKMQAIYRRLEGILSTTFVYFYGCIKKLKSSCRMEPWMIVFVWLSEEFLKDNVCEELTQAW